MVMVLSFDEGQTQDGPEVLTNTLGFVPFISDGTGQGGGDENTATACSASDMSAELDKEQNYDTPEPTFRSLTSGVPAARAPAISMMTFDTYREVLMHKDDIHEAYDFLQSIETLITPGERDALVQSWVIAKHQCASTLPHDMGHDSWWAWLTAQFSTPPSSPRNLLTECPPAPRPLRYRSLTTISDEDEQALVPTFRSLGIACF